MPTPRVWYSATTIWFPSSVLSSLLNVITLLETNKNYYLSERHGGLDPPAGIKTALDCGTLARWEAKGERGERVRERERVRE